MLPQVDAPQICKNLIKLYDIYFKYYVSGYQWVLKK